MLKKSILIALVLTTGGCLSGCYGSLGGVGGGGILSLLSIILVGLELSNKITTTTT